MEEAQKIANGHKKWIVEFLKTKEDYKAKCKEIFDMANDKHCDSLSALLLSLKRGKVIDYPGQFLSDQSPDIEIKLINLDFDPLPDKKGAPISIEKTL